MVVKVLEMAYQQRGNLSGVLLHSNQGSQCGSMVDIAIRPGVQLRRIAQVGVVRVRLRLNCSRITCRLISPSSVSLLMGLVI